MSIQILSSSENCQSWSAGVFFLRVVVWPFLGAALKVATYCILESDKINV